jgi:branched-chain amino acid transport system substrate-binding protein
MGDSRRFKVVGLAALLVVAISACSSSATASSGGGDAAPSGANPPIPAGPITIGAPLGLSGFVSFYDGPLLAGVKLAIADINAKGGVLGHKLRLVTANTKSDQTQIAIAGQQVIDEGAEFMIPTMDYDYGGPAARVASAHKVISITTSGDPRMGDQGIGPYAFNLYPASPTEGTAAADFAVTNEGWKDVYVLEDVSASHPKTVCQNFTRKYQALGGTIIGSDTFENSDQSIATQITRLRGSLPKTDAIMFCSYPPGGASALKQVRTAGIGKPVILDAAFDGTFWLQALPNEDNTFVMSTGPITPGANTNPAQDRVLAEYQKATGQDPVFGVGLFTGYSAVQAIAAGIEAAKSINSDAVARQLERFTDKQFVIGKVTWTSTCHVPIGQPLQVLQILPGAKEKVAATVTASDAPKNVC